MIILLEKTAGSWDIVGEFETLAETWEYIKKHTSDIFGEIKIVEEISLTLERAKRLESEKQ